MTSFSDLSEPNKVKAMAEARQKCCLAISNIQYRGLPDSPTEILSDIGPLDHDLLLQVIVDNNSNGNAMIMSALSNDTLRRQMEEWVNDVAFNSDYIEPPEIVAPPFQVVPGEEPTDQTPPAPVVL